MKFTRLQILVHLGSLIPLILLIWGFFTDNLTVNPIQEATLRTGKTALVLLLLSLAVTPVHLLFGYRPILKVRRTLGLYAFLYASIHFLIFIGLDYQLDWNLIREAVFEKRYALMGFAAFLTLLPLAITSTKGWQKRIQKNWKRLHRLVYLTGLLAIIHFVWLVKSDIREPLIYGGILLLLFFLRIPFIRRKVSQWKYRRGLPKFVRRGWSRIVSQLTAT
jgi:sulfoxide reductase heme-binding subunit YedZ